MKTHPNYLALVEESKHWKQSHPEKQTTTRTEKEEVREDLFCPNKSKATNNKASTPPKEKKEMP